MSTKNHPVTQPAVAGADIQNITTPIKGSFDVSQNIVLDIAERAAADLPLPLVVTCEVSEWQLQVILRRGRTSALFCPDGLILVNELLKIELAIWLEGTEDSLFLRNSKTASRTEAGSGAK
jgi:hypothetical protein